MRTVHSPSFLWHFDASASNIGRFPRRRLRIAAFWRAHDGSVRMKYRLQTSCLKNSAEAWNGRNRQRSI